MSVIRRNTNINSTYWIFTVNNPIVDETEFQAQLRGWRWFKYCVFQLEKGQNGTEHWQGYLELNKSLPFSTVKNFFKPMVPHIEKRLGSAKQARDYAMKEDTRVKGPWEVGTFIVSNEQGKRNDIHGLMESINEGKDNEDLLKEHPVAYIRYYKAVQHVRTMRIPPKIRDLEVIIHYGPPGVGKTWDIINDEEDLFIKPIGKNLWFDGYTDQSVILLDDFSGQCTLTDLLRLLDKYRLQVEIKGGHAWVHATKIFLTTNIHPRDWYDFTKREEQYKALGRRFNKVYFYSEYGKRRRITPTSFFDSCGLEYLFEDEQLNETTPLEEEEEEEENIDAYINSMLPSAPELSEIDEYTCTTTEVYTSSQ